MGQRPRPRGWWFALGGLLVLLAPVVLVGGLVWTLRPLTQTDGSFAADGRSHRLTLPSGTQRAVFAPSQGTAHQVSCLIADGAGAPITPRGMSASYGSTHDGVEYDALLQFGTGDGTRVLTCTVPAGVQQVRIYVGAVPATSSLVLGILVSVVVPIVLGLAGLLVLLVTAILWSRRPPRPAR